MSQSILHTPVVTNQYLAYPKDLKDQGIVYVAEGQMLSPVPLAPHVGSNFSTTT